MLDRDNAAHQVQNNELINTVYKEAHDIAGDHLAALGLIEDLAAEDTEQYRDRNRYDRCEHHSGDAYDLPV